MEEAHHSACSFEYSPDKLIVLPLQGIFENELNPMGVTWYREDMLKFWLQPQGLPG